jgi:signal transduction histidine kinase
MIGTKLFRKHYTIAAVVLLLFIFLGILANILIIRAMSPHNTVNPPMFFARLIDRLAEDSHDRRKSLSDLIHLNDHELPFQLLIVDEAGKVIAPADAKSDFDWNTVAHPKAAYEFTPFDTKDDSTAHFHGFIRFQGEPAQYLYVRPMKSEEPHPRRSGGNPVDRPPPLKYILSTIGLLVLSVLLGIGFSITLIFRSIQDKVDLADTVISELQRGNLKARFPIDKHDEFGQAMKRFNQMAEEIEHLVEQLKNVEKSRMSLLQELAHDLRTPVASLKNLLETMHLRDNTLDAKTKDELMQLSIKEVDYFERLIEDLLILAQVSEPRYRLERLPVSARDLLEEEAEIITAKSHSQQNHPIKIKKELAAAAFEINGDPLLLRRMFRNALDNAFSFARQSVRLRLEVKENEVAVFIEDDGIGLSPEALEAYGVRRVTRFLGTSQEGRLSVGLGSVIMKTVAELHRGTLTAFNRQDEGGNVIGATIQIILPLFK